MTSQPAPPHAPVAEGCYMIGRRNPESILQCNTYLRSFSQADGGDLHWLIDPGSQIDYDEVRRNLLGRIGELPALQLFSVNHQDPDVVGNLPAITSENPRLVGLVSEDAWRLIRHLDVRADRLLFANQLRNNVVKLRGGRRLQVVPTPFCHFRGAMAFYDPESRVLFTGDLFAGLNAPGRVQLLAEEEDWPGIAQFHQIYMPTRSVVEFAIRQIRGLRPKVEVIAPQHGFVLRGDFMHEVMERLEQLPVGADLMTEELDERHLADYGEVLQDVLGAAALHLGRDEALSRLRRLPSDHELAEAIEVAGADVRLRAKGIRAMPLVVNELSRGEPGGFRDVLKSRALWGCTERGAPLPDMGVGVEERGAEDAVVPPPTEFPIDRPGEEPHAEPFFTPSEPTPSPRAASPPSISTGSATDVGAEKAEQPARSSSFRRFVIQETCVLVVLAVLVVALAWLQVWRFPELVEKIGRITGIEIPDALLPHNGGP